MNKVSGLNLITNNLEINLEKIKAITNQFKLIYLKKLQRFIEFYNYFIQFIRRFFYLTRLLSELTRNKNVIYID